MQRNHYTITKIDLFDLFTRLADKYRVIVPYAKGEHFHFGEFRPNKEEAVELGGIRQSQPAKSFLSLSREKAIDQSSKDSKPLVLAGIKGCDLSSFTLQDFVFKKGDFEDPSYIERRDKTIVIASDCTFARQTCFCLAMDGAPYPQQYHDIGLAFTDGHFLVEVNSEKGQRLIDSYKMFFKEGQARDVEMRDKNRERVCSQIRDFIAKRGTQDTASIKGTVKKNYYNVELWQDFASTCVECGACNLVCPTCHCFLLFDEKLDSQAARMRIWDSCLYYSFAKVAGGANPRKHLYERLRNRFEKKFTFFPHVLNYFACTGCGRCIEACPGDIDIREVLKGCVTGKWNKPPND